MLKDNLTDWIGRTQTQQGRLPRETAAMVHATLGTAETSAPTDGAPMPPLWHWCAFNDDTPMSGLGRDGHPKRGGFLPPVRLDRRMWAGGEVTFLRDPSIGADLSRVSTIRSVVEKDGKAGPMVFVTVAHEIADADGVALREIQNIVYLDLPAHFSPPPKMPVIAAPDFETEVPISETLLFRYSAATFNGHRIHYDLAYAQEVEKYPGLVVHGPLQATLMVQEACRATGRRPRHFTYRGVHPMFHFDRLSVCGKATDAGLELCTAVPGSHRGMTGTLTWEEET